jgi:glycosylphosphatidylinositol deacylase
VSHEFGARQLKPLDVFTVDFNEDFSALHEPTLLAQRQYVLDAITYILSLYAPGARIFLIGHSMGGVVSTSVLPHPYISGVITLSTPHAIPPARYSSGMDKFYHRTYQALLPLNVTTPIISICGGATDLMIPSESCMLPIWPNSTDRNRKALFSSAMEGCWAGVGHQVSVWCHQVRWRVARAILEAQSKTSDAESFATMGHWLNDGVHSADMQAQRLDPPVEWEVRSSSELFMQRIESGSKGYLLPLPADAEAFTLLASAGKIFNQGSIDSHELNIELFLCSGSQDAPGCSTVENPQVSVSPVIYSNQEFPLPGEGVHESNGISVLELPLSQTATPRYIGILVHAKGASSQSQSWVKAAFSRTPSLEFHFNWWSK